MSAAQSPARPVVFLPGAIMPATLQYEPLLKVLKDQVRPFLKELEVYAGDAPPPDYHLDQEVEAIKRFAGANGLTAFDLVAYSGGGAVALAFVARYPEPVRSLALTEPAVIPSRQWRQEPQARAYLDEMNRVMSLPPPEQLREFMRANLRPGVQLPPPPPGPPPPWMAKRPAGLRAMASAFETYDFDLADLRRFGKPVYLAVGSLTSAVEEHKAETLRAFFPDFRLEIYEGLHHFNPPQRAEPERYARALRAMWAREAA